MDFDQMQRRELEELIEQFEKLSTQKYGANDATGGGAQIPLEVFQKRFLPNHHQISKLLWKVFDFDGDGKINQQDFITGMAVCRSPVEAREKLIFRMFDEKKIEKANLTAMRELLGEPTNPKKAPQTVKQTVWRGEWDYPKQSDKELGFKAGEYFSVLSDVDETWLYVQNASGEQGYVPKAFIRTFETEVAAPVASDEPKESVALVGIDSLEPNAEGDVTLEQFLGAAKQTVRVRKLCDELIRFDTRAPPEQEITGPSDFKHHAHVGFNAKTGGFDVERLPEEWKKLFTQAGISDAELADPTTAAMLVNVINNEQQKSTLLKSGGKSQPVENIEAGWESIDTDLGAAPAPPPRPSVPHPDSSPAEKGAAITGGQEQKVTPKPLPTPGGQSGARPLPKPAGPPASQRPLPTPGAAAKPAVDAAPKPPALPPRKLSQPEAPQAQVTGAPAPPPAPPSGGPPPPPPPRPAGGAPPPPPPSKGAPAGGNKAMNDSVAPSASVTNLLTDIRKGKQLKKVDPDELNIASMDETEVTNLADVLRKAMVVRRQDIAEGGDATAQDNDDDWD